MRPTAVAVWVAAAVLALVAAPAAFARPVPIGRYVELPYGIAPDHPYPTEGGGPARAGRSRTPAPESAPSRVWETRVPIGRAFPPAVDRNGVLYVAGMAGLASVAPDGQVRFSLRLGFTTGTPSLTPEGFVAVGTQGGELVVASREGEPLVRTRVGGAIRGSPLVLADGSIVAAGFDRMLHRVDAEGRRIFNSPVATQVQGTPAWSTNAEIVLPVGQELLFFTPRGEIRTRTILGAAVVAGPAIADDGTIWALTSDGALHAVDPGGRVRSRSEIDMHTTLSSAFAVGADGAVRIGGREERVVCVGPTGTERWRLEGEGAFLGGLTVDPAGVTLGVNQHGRLMAIDPEGNVRWRVEVGVRVHGAPVVGADGTVYVVTERGTLQAWR